MPPLLKGRRASVLTTKGMKQREGFRLLEEALGGKSCGVCTDVVPNPDVESILSCTRQISSFKPEILIALGGGSVLDAAKVVAILLAAPFSKTALQEILDGNISLPKEMDALPVIAIPTTSGTGSEVTSWSAVWNKKTGQKYSLSHQCMYPEAALLVPALTATLSYENTLFPALDALSQSMETVWNRNANPVSDALAMQAMTCLFGILKKDFRRSFEALSVRKELQKASLLTGLAFSNTETAIAHSLSYPLTGKKGVPHGLACSFTLPEILRFNYQGAPERVTLVLKALGFSHVEEAIEALYMVFEDLGIWQYLRNYIMDPCELQELQHLLVSAQRARNNIVPFSQEAAVELLTAAFGRIVGRRC
ncbi:MAG: phosphonoacetaldehyde reductase [Deltaproteobacteria bacterium]|nr:phosphonoacetaldehyde reductase [Deltaproteobacteria bacterium]MBI4223731.1 phosphonoacetaldehyde reductase [Deltaproteobacteria bacterium]